MASTRDVINNGLSLEQAFRNKYYECEDKLNSLPPAEQEKFKQLHDETRKHYILFINGYHNHFQDLNTSLTKFHTELHNHNAKRARECFFKHADLQPLGNNRFGIFATDNAASLIAADEHEPDKVCPRCVQP
jgi:hypothetical protein